MHMEINCFAIHPAHKENKPLINEGLVLFVLIGLLFPAEQFSTEPIQIPNQFHAFDVI